MQRKHLFPYPPNLFSEKLVSFSETFLQMPLAVTKMKMKK